MKPALITGEQRAENGSFYPGVRYGKVIAITFLNQGVNSLAKIGFGAAEVVLPSGLNRQGASMTYSFPEGYCDGGTEFKIRFAGSGGIEEPNLVIMVTRLPDSN